MRLAPGRDVRRFSSICPLRVGLVAPVSTVMLVESEMQRFSDRAIRDNEY
jgi:hypothetical protein